jgi:hypothetical protein
MRHKADKVELCEAEEVIPLATDRLIPSELRMQAGIAVMGAVGLPSTCSGDQPVIPDSSRTTDGK